MNVNISNEFNFSDDYGAMCHRGSHANSLCTQPTVVHY